MTVVYSFFFFVVVFFQPLGENAKGLFYIVLPSVTRWAMMRLFISFLFLPTGGGKSHDKCIINDRMRYGSKNQDQDRHY